MSNKCLLLFLFLGNLLAGCVHLSLNEVDPKVAQSIRRIVVISVSADKLFQVHEGVSPLSYKKYDMDIEAWHLDDTLVQQVASATTALGKYDVQVPAYDRVTLVSELGKLGTADVPYVYSPKWRDRIAPLLRSVADQNSADTILLLMRFPGGPGVSGLSEGLGIYSSTGGAAKSYVSAALMLLQGKTGEVIVGRRVVTLKPKDIKVQNPEISIFPMQDISQDLAKTQLDMMTPAQQANLREAVEALLQDSSAISETLRELFGVRR
jgi:hypothetical protein